MKKILLTLVILAIAVPAMAAVTITPVKESATVVRIDYSAPSAAERPRAFALDITVAGGATITGISNYFVGACTSPSNRGYGIFPGTIVIDADGIVTSDGSPVAPDSDLPADTQDGLGTSGITVEMGSLYGDVGNAPALGGTLCKVTITGAWTGLTVAANVSRGGVVLENATAATTNLPQTILAGTVVPNIISMTIANANTAITGAGLVVGTTAYAWHATIAKDLVCAQDPASGTTVAPGSAVNKTVSKGPQPIVPNIVSMTIANANTAITSAGLVVGTTAYAWHATIAKDLVCAQSPASGTPVESGSAVNKTVSRGPQPTVCMPAAGTGYDAQRTQFNAYVTKLWDPTQWCAYNATTNPKGGFQCHGDADGLKTGTPYYYRVSSGDLNLITGNWKRKQLTYPDGADPRADIDHKITGTPYYYAVSSGDLNRVTTNWKRKDAPAADGLPRNCPLTDTANNTYVKP